MQTNRALLQLVESNPAGSTRSSWTQAYIRFLFSRDESLPLKLAPLALFGLLPIDVLSNVIPGVGELDDLGFMLAFGVVAFRTVRRVRRYR